MALFGKLIGAFRNATKSLLSIIGASGGKDAHKHNSIPTEELSSKEISQENAPQLNTIRQAQKKWNFNGQSKTVTEWAKELGVSASTIRKRIKKFGTVMGHEEEVRPISDFKDIKILKVGNDYKIEADGKTYSLYLFAKQFGINFSTLYGRVQKGWDIQDIIKSARKSNRDYEKTSPIRAKLWEWNGEKHTVKEWAQIYGIKHAMMRKRLLEHGSPERNTDKLEAYKANRAKKYIWNGETHTIKEWAQIYNVAERTMAERWQRHHSPEIKPKDLPLKSKSQNVHQEDSDDCLYGCDGEWKKISEWARIFGIPEHTIRENFERYGTPTKPAFEIGSDYSDETDDERDIDEILKEIDAKHENNKNKQESIGEWLDRITKEPDDGKPLREILGIDETSFRLVR